MLAPAQGGCTHNGGGAAAPGRVTLEPLREQRVSGAVELAGPKAGGGCAVSAALCGAAPALRPRALTTQRCDAGPGLRGSAAKANAAARPAASSTKHMRDRWI